MPPPFIPSLSRSIYEQYRALLDRQRRGEPVHLLELTLLAMQSTSLRVLTDLRRVRAGSTLPALQGEGSAASDAGSSLQ
jgi:hypothetical protein